MAEHLRLAKAGEAPPQRGRDGFVMTETARDILRSLELVRDIGGAAMTMIAGAPGVGKTKAVKHFADQLGDRCIYIPAVCGEGTPWHFAQSLSRWWVSVERFNSVVEARELFARYIGPDRLLIVDEAQYLDQKPKYSGMKGEAFEWLRGMAESGQFQLVLCGDLRLVPAVAAMPQLHSRVRAGRPVVIESVTTADVQAIASGTGFAMPDAISMLTAVARQKGGLRNVENVLRLARLFAGNGRPELAHLKAAILDMKLAPKGGK